MAKTTLKVKVIGGTPPFSIKATLFKGQQVIKKIEKPGGFEQLYDNLSGKYSLLISGPNPLGEDKKTVISVDTSEITLSNDSDSSPATRKGKAYLVQYHFTTKNPV